MLKFKDFLLKEDIGIGPDGTIKNPSIKNYMDSLKKEKKDIIQQKKLSVGSKEEKDRLNELLQQKRQEIEQTRLLSNPATVDTANVGTSTTLNSSLTPTPSAKESAFDKLIRGKPSTTVSAPQLSTTLNPAVSGSPETSIYSGYNISRNLNSSTPSPQLDVEIRGKTSKNIKL